MFSTTYRSSLVHVLDISLYSVTQNSVPRRKVSVGQLTKTHEEPRECRLDQLAFQCVAGQFGSLLMALFASQSSWNIKRCYVSKRYTEV